MIRRTTGNLAVAGTGAGEAAGAEEELARTVGDAAVMPVIMQTKGQLEPYNH
jgi:hypothetical protein